MKRREWRVGLLVGAAALLVLTGCGGGLTNDYTAAMLATPEVGGLVASEFAELEGGSGEPAAEAPADADNGSADGSAGGGRGRLSEEQRAQIRALEAQLDAGALTPEQFAAQVDTLLGEPQRGGRWGRRIRERFVERLQLTEEQQTAARDIHTAARHEVRKLRIAALGRARLALTEAQREKLAALRTERFASLRDKDSGRHIGRRPPARRAAFMGRLATALELTDEQRTQMRSIRQELRNAVRAQHEAARDQFRALLTNEQKQTLEQMRGRLQRGRANRAGGAGRGA